MILYKYGRIFGEPNFSTKFSEGKRIWISSLYTNRLHVKAKSYPRDVGYAKFDNSSAVQVERRCGALSLASVISLKRFLAVSLAAVINRANISPMLVHRCENPYVTPIGNSICFLDYTLLFTPNVTSVRHDIDIRNESINLIAVLGKHYPPLRKRGVMFSSGNRTEWWIVITNSDSNVCFHFRLGFLS